MGIWDQLNTKTIADNAGTDIQVQSNPVHLQESNRAELQDIKLINESSLRSDNGIIPGTLSFKVHNFTDNDIVTVIEPAKGEVWRILLPIAKVTAGSVSTTPTYQLWLRDTATSINYRIGYYSSTSASPIVNEDLMWDGEAFVLGEGQAIQAQIGSFSATNISFGVLAGRVR